MFSLLVLLPSLFSVFGTLFDPVARTLFTFIASYWAHHMELFVTLLRKLLCYTKIKEFFKKEMLEKRNRGYIKFHYSYNDVNSRFKILKLSIYTTHICLCISYENDI